MSTGKAGYHLLHKERSSKESCFNCVLPFRDDNPERIIEWSLLLDKFFTGCDLGKINEALEALKEIAAKLKPEYWRDFIDCIGLFGNGYLEAIGTYNSIKQEGGYTRYESICIDTDDIFIYAKDEISPFLSLKILFDKYIDVDVQPLRLERNPFKAILQGDFTIEVFKDCRRCISHECLLEPVDYQYGKETEGIKKLEHSPETTPYNSDNHGKTWIYEDELNDENYCIGKPRIIYKAIRKCYSQHKDKKDTGKLRKCIRKGDFPKVILNVIKKDSLKPALTYAIPRSALNKTEYQIDKIKKLIRVVEPS